MDPSYNNSFGNGTPASYGTGDIILAPDDDSSGKSRKGLVIALIVLVVLLVGAGVGFAVWKGMRGGEGGGESGGSVALSELEEKFNIYANYMISGEAKTDPVEGEYDVSNWYALEGAVADGNIAFLDSLDEYWTEYKNAFETIPDYYNDDTLLILMEAQDELNEFVGEILRVRKLSYDDLLKMYEEYGKEGAMSEIEVTYEPLKNVAYKLGVKYANGLIADARMRIEIMDFRSQNDCLYNSECSDEVQKSILELWWSDDGSSNRANLSIADESVQLMIENCLALNQELKSKSVEFDSKELDNE